VTCECEKCVVLFLFILKCWKIGEMRLENILDLGKEKLGKIDWENCITINITIYIMT